MNRAATALAVFLLAGTPAAAQQPRDSTGLLRDSAAANQRAIAAVGQGRRHAERRPSPWLPRLRLDNDAYNFWIHPGHRSDEEFTNGVTASVEALRGAMWGSRLAPDTPDCGSDNARTGRCLATSITLGQDMYTPNLRRPPFARPDWEDERPYAAWLYLGLTGRSVSRRSARIVDVQLGVTGTPAGGQVSQKVAHWINQRFTTPAEGWDTQVGFQPGVQVGYTHALLALRGSIGSKAVMDLVPSASVQLGTVRTAVQGGGKVRFGYNLSHPIDPRAWPGRTPLEYWVSAGGRAAHVARDFSLDGSLSGGRRVSRVAGVRDYAFGAGLRMHRLLVEWEATTRSRQYLTGPLHHTFSAMTATWEFYR